jgi:3-dehydroquinate synthase
VVTSCAAKARIVARDERETGERALLNLGHTFGHAIEVEAGFDGRLVHGEAVAVGMVLAFALSARLGHCSEDDCARMRRHIDAMGLPVTIAQALGANAAPEVTAEILIGHMAQDKKVQDGKVTFVLARAIGDAFLSRDVPGDALGAVISDSLAG